jgi:hypothetical protein
MIDAFVQVELITGEPEVEMMAQLADITDARDVSLGSLSAETPLQRQILMWQRELIRRAERKAGKRVGG